CSEQHRFAGKQRLAAAKPRLALNTEWLLSGCARSHGPVSLEKRADYMNEQALIKELLRRPCARQRPLLSVYRVTFLFVVFCILGLGSAGAQARIGAEESNKLVVEKSDPVYPPLAKATGVQGVVRVDLTISEAGAVISAKAIEGHPLLKDAAVQAARK